VTRFGAARSPATTCGSLRDAASGDSPRSPRPADDLRKTGPKASPLIPGLGWTDYGETLTNSRAFYRLRQW